MTAIFDPRSLTGNKTLDDMIRDDLKPNAKKLNLGFGLDQNNIKGVANFPLISTGNVPTNIALRNAGTSHLWSRNNKVFKDIEKEFEVKERSGNDAVLNTHKILFSVDTTREHSVNKEDKTHLRGLTSKYFGIPDRPDIKLETAAVNEIHMNTRTGHFEPVTAKQIQASNARTENDEFEEETAKILTALKQRQTSDKRYDDMENGVKKKTKLPSDKSVDDMEKGKSTKVLTRKLLPPIVRPALPPQAGGGPDPANFQ